MEELNEFIEYPLRVFDTLRRLSYVAFYYFLTGDENRFESITEKISLVINNNYPACKSPLCEFNYNDTGITLAVLYLSGKKELAKKWLLDIADFIIVQSLTGHRLMPLGEGIEKVTEFIISTPFVEVDSDILLLILEFSVVLNFDQVYNLIKPHRE